MNANKNDAPVDSRHSTEQHRLVISISQKFQSDLENLGRLIKKHEDDLSLLQSQRNEMERTILDLRVALGKYNSYPKAMDHVCSRNEEETHEIILKHDKSAAGVLYQLKSHHGSQASEHPVIKDVLGTVATLGRVEDDNLSRVLSEYLGKDLMLAIVCKTYDGVKALEEYNSNGSIIESSGLHGLGASIGRPLTSRFTVICLEKLRPYFGQFVDREPQRRLDLLRPRLPNGSPPPGFIGFAVNMINIDTENLSGLTPNGLGLRESLFYSLLSSLQVYQTREEMLQASPFLDRGAVSLDGGIVKPNGLLILGDPARAETCLRFLKSSGGVVYLPVSYYETKKKLNEMESKKEKALGDMKRAQLLLDNTKAQFKVKKAELLRFLAEGTSQLVQHEQRQQAGQTGQDRG